MQISDNPCQLSVYFLRIGREFIPRPQTCLNMTDTDSIIKSRKTRNKCRCCISMHEHDIRIRFFHYFVQADQSSCCDISKGLTILHNVKIIVRLN